MEMDTEKLFKRERTFRVIVSVLFLLLTGRFIYFSILKGGELSEQADAMKTGEASIASIRGRICDRLGISLTPTTKSAKILINKSFFELNEEAPELDQLAGYLQTSMSHLKSQIENSEVFCTFITTGEVGKKISSYVTEKQLNGVSVLLYDSIGNQTGLAQHLVGYLDNNGEKGTAGLELAYDSLLRTSENLKVTYIQDALQQAINGTSIQIGNVDEVYNAHINTSYLYTTIEYRMQKAVEDVLDTQKKFKGAVVLSDVETGEILAMASRPDFDRTSVSALISELTATENSNGTNDENKVNNKSSVLVNRATTAYPPGSIAKIIDSAAWLETFGTDFSFYCTGSIEANGNRVACNAENGHGEMDLPQAFAHSCNPFYVQLTRMLGTESVIEMAKRFGFGQTTNLTNQGVAESAGSLPLVEEIYNEGDLANLSLGQGAFTATPVQINAMMAAVANGGIYCEPTVLKSVNGANGQIIKQFEGGAKRRVVSENTAANLQTFCVGTVSYGTGHYAAVRTETIDGVAGKTGTAEVANEKAHAWFSGYFPLSSPKYAMTVLWENGEHGGSVAGTLFKKICKKL